MTPREVPLLYSTPMAAALCERRKFETRRPIKMDARLLAWLRERGDNLKVRTTRSGKRLYYGAARPPAELAPIQPGDRIWPRETWRPWAWHEGEPMVIEFRAGGRREETGSAEDAPGYEDWYLRIFEQASKECEAAGLALNEKDEYEWEDESPLKWRSPIFLPRWCSRWRLPVAEVRAERIQEITDDGAIAEGIEPLSIYERDGARLTFADYWDQLHGGDAWEINDWAWVYRWEEIVAV